MCLLKFYKAVACLKFHLLQPLAADPGNPLKQQTEAPKFLGESLSCLRIREAAQMTVAHRRIAPNFLLLPAAEVAPTQNSWCDFDLTYTCGQPKSVQVEKHVKQMLSEASFTDPS